MPVIKKGDKWAIGSGKAIYPDKATAERAYKGYLGAKHMKKQEPVYYPNEENQIETKEKKIMDKAEKTGKVTIHNTGQWALKCEPMDKGIMSTAKKVKSVAGEGARAIAGAVGTVASHPIQATKDVVNSIGHGIKKKSVMAGVDKMADSKSVSRAMKIGNAMKTEPKEETTFNKHGQWKIS